MITHEIEHFGTILIDEVSWIDEDGVYAVCWIESLNTPLKMEDLATFYFDVIPEIETNLQLMPQELAFALFQYQLEYQIEIDIA